MYATMSLNMWEKITVFYVGVINVLLDMLHNVADKTVKTRKTCMKLDWEWIIMTFIPSSS